MSSPPSEYLKLITKPLSASTQTPIVPHDPTWSAPYPQIGSDNDYRDTCEKATADAALGSIQSIRLETGDHQDTTFKVLDRSVTPQISIPKIRLPRNQVSQLPNRASCTVAIAFISSMKAGASLPGHLQWPSGSSDITTVRDLLNMPDTNGLFSNPASSVPKTHMTRLVALKPTFVQQNETNNVT